MQLENQEKQKMVCQFLPTTAENVIDKYNGVVDAFS
jgi:hypothetical protein